jgi:hypothetical protein
MLFRHKRKHCQNARFFDFSRQLALVLRAGTGDSAGQDLAALGDKTPQGVCLFVVDFQLLGAEFAHFLFEKHLTRAAAVAVSAARAAFSALAPLIPIFPLPAGAFGRLLTLVLPAFCFGVGRFHCLNAIYFISHIKLLN